MLFDKCRSISILISLYFVLILKERSVYAEVYGCNSGDTQYPPNERQTTKKNCKMSIETSSDGIQSRIEEQQAADPSVQKEKFSESVCDLLLREANYTVPENSCHLKRQDYLSWEDYFMYIAFLSALRSKDPNTNVGACIVNPMKRIVGIGYNGFPAGCSDDILPWATANTTSWLHTKHPFECHAEMNAILNKCGEIQGGTIYVVHFPCHECAKLIIQAGITGVVFCNERDKSSESNRAARILFGLAGVSFRKHVPKRECHALQLLPTDNTELEIKRYDLTQTAQSPCHSSNEKSKRLLLDEAGYEVPDDAASLKRRDYLTWDDYFMAVAFLSAQRSKDPNTQVGACIVNSSKRIVGIGYNGFPAGCSDDVLPWARNATEGSLHTKYPYVCHAEANAILNKGAADVRGSTIYVALFPCNDCAKLIVQSGIRQVVFLHDKYHDTDGCRASRIMFEMAGVRLRQLRPRRGTIFLNLRAKLSEDMKTEET